MTIERSSNGQPLQRFCIVGLGNHARTKLIPALITNAQRVVGLVTQKSEPILPAIPVFRHLGEAISELPADTVFVIATPPAVHFEQAMAVMKAGRDLILEKPAFITEREVTAALAEAVRRRTILVEAFMYRHTELYRRLITYWRTSGSSVEAIDIAFLVPRLPVGTFRQANALAASNLYDIGCYALSLLADLELPLQSLELTAVDCAGVLDKEALQLTASLKGVSITARAGIGETYLNAVSFRQSNGLVTAFSPFFYGRSGKKAISKGNAPSMVVETFHDHNAFEKMFAVPRCIWLNSLQKRAKQMIDVTAALERLGQALDSYRRNALDPFAHGERLADGQ